MSTLYELLGALPDDGAEDLRAAFRRAVKGTHPDIHPDDPDAALKFRRIVRASEILGDSEQRAAYDHLLDLAHQEQATSSGRATAAKVHRVASGVFALAGASVVTVSGFLLFMHMSAASVAPANNTGLALRAPVEIASLGKGESAGISVEAVIPDAVASNAREGNAEPASSRSANESGSSPVRRISTERDSDLDNRIASLDQAFQPDPRRLPSYVDRGIIFYRLQSVGRAFADIARPKRTEKPGRVKSETAISARQRADQAAVAASMVPLPRPRSAAQDPSRQEAYASIRLR